MIRGLEHLSCEERLRERGFSAWRRLWGDLSAALQYLKGACRKDGDNLFSKACCDRTRSIGFKLREGRFRQEEIFYNEGGETLGWVTQRGDGGLIPENIQGQVGWGSEQPGLVNCVPAYCWEVGLGGF